MSPRRANLSHGHTPQHSAARLNSVALALHINMGWKNIFSTYPDQNGVFYAFTTPTR